MLLCFYVEHQLQKQKHPDESGSHIPHLLASSLWVLNSVHRFLFLFKLLVWAYLKAMPVYL